MNCPHGQASAMCATCLAMGISRTLTISTGMIQGLGQQPDRAYSGLDPECVPNDHMVGLRSFRVDELGRLFPVNASTKPWRPGENVAECKRGGHKRVDDAGDEYRDHFDPDCRCGFYAFHNGDNSFNGDGQVTAVVKGYGRTVIGTRGFRCEKAEILGVVLPESEGKAEPFDRWKHRRKWRAKAALWWLLALAFVVGAIAIPANSWLSLFSAILFAGLLIGIAACAVWGGKAWFGYLDPACTQDVDGYPFTRGMHSHYYGKKTRRGDQCKCSTVEWRQGKVKGDDKPLPERTAELIRRNYPSVTSYPSRKAMIEAHPLTPPIEPPAPTPDQPDFWERPAKGLRASA